MINITGSVGKNGMNRGPDVRLIQRLLNASDLVTPVAVDSRFGPQTFRAILQYQMSVFPFERDWDGLIGRLGKTLRALGNPNTHVNRHVRSAEGNVQAIRLGGSAPSVKPALPVHAIVPLKIVTSDYHGVSGTRWCEEFPTSTSTVDLASPFRENVNRFRTALINAGISTRITATFRPVERAWLMHWAYNIAHGADPKDVPAKAGIEIDWTHENARGRYDASASVTAALAMNNRYRTQYKPSLTSLHISGNAIDMAIDWNRSVSILDATGRAVTLAPNTGAKSLGLQAVAASYGVFKLANDEPHWSSTGR